MKALFACMRSQDYPQRFQPYHDCVCIEIGSVVSQTTSTLQTQDMLVNIFSAHRRNLCSNRACLWSLIETKFSSCTSMLGKGEVRRVYCYGGCAIKFVDVCVDAGISGTFCSTEVWECSSTSHSGCTRSLHARDKAYSQGQGAVSTVGDTGER